MTAATKAKLTASEHCPEIREGYYKASDGLRALASALNDAGLQDLRASVLEAIRALDETDLGVVL